MRLALLFDDEKTQQIINDAQSEAYERFERLTTRQRQIAALLAEGLPNKVIAHRIGIAERTVENHRSEIMERTGSKTFASLVRLVVLAG